MNSIPTEDECAKVLAAIPKGKEYGASADEIARRARITKERRTQFPTRHIIRELIRRGYKILSSTNHGYWISDDPEEIAKYAESLRRRARAICARARDIER